MSAERRRAGIKPSGGRSDKAAPSQPDAQPGVPQATRLDDWAHEIQQLIDILKRNELAELEWEGDGYRIRLKRDGASLVAPPVVRESQPALKELPAEKPAGSPQIDRPGVVTVTSPIVGTFYRSPSPDADPYVEEGDLVKKGQVLCIVEAMKLMNEIESEVDGRIITILAESTKAVEYGQPLFLIDSTPGA